MRYKLQHGDNLNGPGWIHVRHLVRVSVYPSRITHAFDEGVTKVNCILHACVK